MGHFLVLCLTTVFVFSCTRTPTTQKDSFLWLEKVEGEKALSWVREQNKKTLNDLTLSQRFKELQASALKILQAKDRIPAISFRGSYVYNFWQDEKHIRGLWRRTSVKDYKKPSPRWETLLDLDALAKKEKENWVYKGSQCLAPQFERCLLVLSRGGKDASVIREFDVSQRNFVKGGFRLPEAKSDVSWLDEDHIFVGTDFGKDSLTESGYPRIVKLWKRGTPLKEAKTISEAKKSDVLAYSLKMRHLKDEVSVVLHRESFFTSVYWIYEKGKLKKLPLQKTAEVLDLFHGFLIVSIKDPWSVAGQKIPAGSLVALSKKAAGGKISQDQIQVVYVPDERSTVVGVAVTANRLLINNLENVRGKILEVKFKNNQLTKPKPMMKFIKAHLGVAATSRDSSDFFVGTRDFLQPDALYFYENGNGKASKIKSLPDRFNNQSMTVEQRWATSKDGTRVPYFLIGKKSQIQKGGAPTLLYGYGGFESSVTPRYKPFTGKVWLSKGGLYVVANIRGGGEFGPKWHKSAQKKNRHKAYDDFIAVAEDLIQSKITTRDQLAIEGRSNGGLLMGAVMTRRPDLFKAVLCVVPLLDMIRYTKLLAGISWVGEYGDPENKKMRKYLLSYSPYHNIKKDQTYPDLFLLTSTKDDRVHPGHARKMAAKMMSLGHKNIRYYENIEGGHGMSSNLKQKAKMTALSYEFLFRTIW